MNIIKNTSFGGYNVSVRTVKPSYIVIHYVGAVSSARNNVTYFNGGNRHASADFFVDEKEICQFNPDLNRYYSWHCGGGRQTSYGGTFYGKCGNWNSIGIEICCINTAGEYLGFDPRAVDQTVELVKSLMRTYGIPVGNVIRHYDVTGKFCPSVDGWIPVIGSRTETAWHNFKARLTGEPSQPTETTEGENVYMFTTELVKNGSTGASAKLLQTLLKGLGYKGSNGKDLDLDGIAGTNTVYAIVAYQKSNGLVADGIAGANTWKKILGV